MGFGKRKEETRDSVFEGTEEQKLGNPVGMEGKQGRRRNEHHQRTRKLLRRARNL